MKTICLNFLALIYLTLCLPAQALSPADLRSGDVILLSLDCYECRMIEEAEGSRFSHSGIVLVDGRGQVFVAEALGDVHHMDLASFLSRSAPDRPPVVMRNKELAQLSVGSLELNAFNRQILFSYLSKYHGASFDPDYLWDNFGAAGEELYYCSEFVVKLLNEFLGHKIPTQAMSFKDNLEYWEKHFPNGVPEGKPGVSPGDIYLSSLFAQMGTLQL